MQPQSGGTPHRAPSNIYLILPQYVTGGKALMALPSVFLVVAISCRPGLSRPENTT
jgi:hypothetical protein